MLQIRHTVPARAENRRQHRQDSSSFSFVSHLALECAALIEHRFGRPSGKLRSFSLDLLPVCLVGNECVSFDALGEGRIEAAETNAQNVARCRDVGVNG